MARWVVEPWTWTDTERARSRWGLWFRSGEFLTTLFLWGYALVLLSPGSTFATSKAFAWVILVSRGTEAPWSILALTLGLVAPLAVAMDEGRLRVLSLVSQGGLYAFWGASFLVNSRLGLGWWTFAACAAWLLVRAAVLIRHHRGR